MPQIIFARKIKKNLLLVVAGLVVAAVVGALVVWYIVIPGGNTTATIIGAAATIASNEDFRGATIMLKDRLAHTWQPKDRFALEVALGDTYLKDRQWQLAEKAFLAALGSSSADPVAAYKGLAETYRGMRNTAKTREYLQKLHDYYATKYRGNSGDGQNFADFYQAQLDAMSEQK